MAPRKAVVPTELDADDIWGELVSENAVPPMKVAGIVLTPPTHTQIEAWTAAGLARDNDAGEQALFGDQYEAIKKLFADKPNYVWENFNKKYLKHFFGVEDDASLKG